MAKRYIELADQISPQVELHEAMKIVLADMPDRTGTTKQISDEIGKRKLYRQRRGGKALASQINARLSTTNTFRKDRTGHFSPDFLLLIKQKNKNPDSRNCRRR